MYIQRNQRGEIISISKIGDAEFKEMIADDSPELLQFFQSSKSAEQLALEQTDQTMARVLEDVINLLVEQGIIRFTDLPDAAQQKLLTRRELRGKRQGIDLLDDDERLHL
ncbi:MAG TPA: hypothetical protein VL995_08060 [Cellvibrio sp.]|nr:hypothetical protein [Cellvibrio sp.]